MKRYKAWCVCLLAWIIGCSGMALAQSQFENLCQTETVCAEDVVAWIEIPQAGFLQPVMQHSTDDGYYAVHGAGGADSAYGALYTQATYNSEDFSDPVTVVYGSSKAEGAPLRDLQELYSGSFNQCRKILVHLPDATSEYVVFAALPYSSIHILHYYDFTVEHRFERFFDGVFASRVLGMHLDEKNRPQFGEKALILSTGLRGDRTQRYLVMAKPVPHNP